MLNQPIGVALVRAMFGGLLTFGTTTLTTYQVVGSWDDALVAGGVAGLTYILTRGGFEGGWDQKRDQPPPQIAPGDVGRAP